MMLLLIIKKKKKSEILLFWRENTFIWMHTYTINLIIIDGLKYINRYVTKVKNAVKYVK